MKTSDIKPRRDKALHTIKQRIDGVTEETTNGNGRRGREGKHLVDDFTGKGKYWNFKHEALDRILSRTRSGRVFGPIARQTTE
jgi:hypothetical protein